MEFLKYCEERRQEVKRSRDEDEARKSEAKSKEEDMRTSIEFLRSNEDKWRCRRIYECERIKKEDKKDRLAIAKEKKKRYGLKRLSKEENKRLKLRTAGGLPGRVPIIGYPMQRICLSSQELG